MVDTDANGGIDTPYFPIEDAFVILNMAVDGVIPWELYPRSLAMRIMFSKYCDCPNMDSDAAWFNWYVRV